MTPASVQLRISFESLVEAIVSLAPEDKLQLRQILDQEIAQFQENDSDNVSSKSEIVLFQLNLSYNRLQKLLVADDLLSSSAQFCFE
jgi:hypothetical protein